MFPLTRASHFGIPDFLSHSLASQGSDLPNSQDRSKGGPPREVAAPAASELRRKSRRKLPSLDQRCKQLGILVALVDGQVERASLWLHLEVELKAALNVTNTNHKLVQHPKKNVPGPRVHKPEPNSCYCLV